jgi:cyclopropane fatty-acyl-phospholipid synthase-like methyltransferase
VDDPHPRRTDAEHKALVRRGYDAVSYHYRADDDDGPAERGAWIAALVGRLDQGAAVLDLGCGCGVPMAKALVRAGFAVTGVDLSDVQVDRARRLVPEATFLRVDAADVSFPARSFDAVVSLYMFIHLPMDEQAPLIRRIAEWLRPGGILLVTTGHTAWTGTDPDWLGAGAAMWWSHPDAATYRDWFEAAGLVVTAQEFVPEGGGGHALFWCSR